ncbi:MerR family transcriptional regulator [Chitinophaga sancti]|uniref:MerR HTH family regulatory protein n=1 Tax=Chitinophaga sancti TaxID=1004 RepID=A0A1K1SH76_9BACT|nr:MerR family transcriptional regulator [Chitinophaga sancti]WQD59880.1 MerR family transcriptional regulator [Chitinophaga sancti]WQG87989.1 MerR family transcriptional regulator [Chitinophaga sancti]SFW83415.1 MerR HTH family regulatory protein [Chitinophaga sancti]
MAAEMYSIKDLENLSGIKAHTIRIWEKRYGIVQPGRTDTNIRYYSNEDLRRLLNISMLTQHGFKISHISQMTDDEIAQKIAGLSIKNHPDLYGDSLLLSLIDLDEQLFNKAFLEILMAEGFENAIIRFIFPFFHRIGIMWQIGTISPAQEHFISNLIRNKIIVATERISRVPDPALGTVLLFLPENELHEISLLFYNYVLRARGYKTIYLGQSVPHESLERLTHTCSFSFIVTNLTNPLPEQDFIEFCQRLCQVADGAKVYIAGPIPDNLGGRLPANGFLQKDLIERLSMGVSV